MDARLPTAMKKIAIVGTAPSSRFAPYEDPDWEIWGVSTPRTDTVYDKNRLTWFELHDASKQPTWVDKWRDDLRTFLEEDVPLYMFFPELDLSTDVRTLNREALEGRFGSQFLTSSFAWMMAWALVKYERRLDTIAIYGVTAEYGTEYQEQWAGVKHFIYLARELGVTVVTHPDTGLDYEPLAYPFWVYDPVLGKLNQRISKLEKRLAKAEFSLRKGQDGELSDDVMLQAKGALLQKTSQQIVDRTKFALTELRNLKGSLLP